MLGLVSRRLPRCLPGRVPGALLVGLVLLTLPAVAGARPTEFSLEVSPTHGGIGDIYQATVTVELGGLSGPDRYWPPDFGDFEIIGSQTKQGTSSVIDPRRGRQIRTVIVRRYQLRARRSGRLRIKPAKVRIGRDDFETKEVWVTVGPQGGTAPVDPDDPGQDPTAVTGVGVPGFKPPNPRMRAKEMFLHVVADKDNPWVGEQVTVTWLLYTRSEVLKFEPKPPSLDGLWTEILYEPDAYFTYHEDLVGGTPYVVAVVSKRALFATEAGRLEVKPFEARVSSLSTRVGQAHELASDPVVLKVKALPPGAPAGFDPTYVGQFNVESAVDRTEIDASESLTLTVQVSGVGAIRRTTPPQLSFPAFSFRAPRDIEDSVDVSSGTVQGSRTYRYWTTPQVGGQIEMPAIELPYFDPTSASYEVARSRPIPIMVSGDPSQLATPDTSAGRENVVPRDIRLIRTGNAVATRVLPGLYRSPWFWPLALAPVFAFALILLVDRLRQRLKKETPRSRIRRARGRARRRFRVAEIHIRGNRPAKMFGELARILYDHIEEHTGQTVLSMTRDELRDFLAKKGFDKATIKDIDTSLETFDLARFAPSEIGPGEMRAQVRQLKDLLKKIERTPVTDDVRGAA